MYTTASIKEQAHIFPKIIIGILSNFLIITLFSCSDADNFYGELEKQPELLVDNDYKAVYAIGDTLVIKGRLNPGNDLRIRIGGAEARPGNIRKYQVPHDNYGLEYDLVDIVITEEMGLGEDRPVTITSAGISIEAPAIEIVGDALTAILDKQLQLVKVTDIPAGATVLHYRGNDGNAYFWHNGEKKLTRFVRETGQTAEVFNESHLEGNFSISEFYSGSISPDGTYFYFSAKVAEPGQSRTVEQWRLVRFNLQANGLETLNRTEYDLRVNRRTIEAAAPFEGNVHDTDPAKRPKIFQATQIIPDEEGGVYFDLMGHFLAYLDAEGNYTYLFNFNSAHNHTGKEPFVPNIYNPDTRNYYTVSQVHQYLLPGTKIGYGISYIDTKQKKMYTNNLSWYTSLFVTDISTRIQIGDYANNFLTYGDIPYATSSLKRFNGGLVPVSNNTRLNPLPVGGKLLGLYFIDQAPSGNENPNSLAGYGLYELPALCEVDIENEYVRRYAPKRLIFNGFDFGMEDQSLSIDSDGMLYFTANNGTVIVKTEYK
ncbi:MAG TPA: hypothetical protein DDZ96_12625 [Porphyromonadaceae bacterium]|jgi:hypothetical protein|nr:hypothetical protein [Porphyromonadaceae bacterium]HBL34640.1 hypothetical protein [Porphyromonadaceae bacterium]HBX21748.1 hypothetical protein [Porphyromonadaceae bacterium]HCM19738.1 hypothetical protein [Porphyromonadaceae bacterium]